MTPPKPVTRQRVLATLKKAGFKNSKETARFRIRYGGFQVATDCTGIQVFAHSESGESKESNLQGYAQALQAAGIACRVEGGFVVVQGESTGGTPQ